MKDDRLYAKFTLDFPDHPKILCLSTEAKWALVDLTIYSRRHMTDGFIPKAVALAKHGADVCLELATNDAENPSLIESDDGYQIHDFALHQSTKADIESLTEKRRRAGQMGGKARAKQVAKQTASKINPETETETYKNKGDFDAFWEAYPRRIGRKAAEKAYAKALADISPEQLTAAAKAYANSVKDSDAKFIAHATTWLNQGRWDEFTDTAVVDPEQFLRDCWNKGTFGPITALTGYPCPFPEFPGEGEPGFDKETARRDFYRGFIESKQPELLMRVREAM